ncbi:hypothetical protein CDAR_292601 [Caerostris darwini]|uniref:Uncharacterized protein n=1 Tax=Caerostris darwini TaxID=1538125 RepID=A0AAV4PWK5_9ARAC|nr:hypothetical protein CDAR_292601 [Caerostris darwini]
MIVNGSLLLLATSLMSNGNLIAFGCITGYQWKSFAIRFPFLLAISLFINGSLLLLAISLIEKANHIAIGRITCYQWKLYCHWLQHWSPMEIILSMANITCYQWKSYCHRLYDWSPMKFILPLAIRSVINENRVTIGCITCDRWKS